MQEKDEILYLRFLSDQNEEDLRTLLIRHRERLTLFLYSFVQDMDEAEDLMLDCFALIASGTVKYHVMEESSFKTWLFAIARNKARMVLRKKKLNTVDLEEAKALADRESPELDLLREERQMQLYQALNQIHPDYRQVLYLLYFEDMSHEEISQVMQKRVKQIYNLASRGRKSLKETLERMGFEYAEDR